MNKTHPIDQLEIHPLRKALPFAKPNPATVASIAEIGVLQAIKVVRMSDDNGQPTGLLYLVDGVDRWRGAVEAMLNTVPVEIIPQDEVQTTLLHSLVARRHLTKSALAFVAFPLLQPAINEAKDRKLACLKRGEAPSSFQTTTGKTIEVLSEILGVGRDLIFKARNVHGFLAKASKAKREEITSRILSGDLDLTGAIHSLTGNESTSGKNRSTPGQLELFDRDLTSLAARWQKWQTMAEPQRNQVALKFAAQVEEWPEEVIKAVVARLEKGVQ